MTRLDLTEYEVIDNHCHPFPVGREPKDFARNACIGLYPVESEDMRNTSTPGAPHRSDLVMNSVSTFRPSSDLRYQLYPVVGLDSISHLYTVFTSAVTSFFFEVMTAEWIRHVYELIP